MSGRRGGTGRRLADGGGMRAAPRLEGMQLPHVGVTGLMVMSFVCGGAVALLGLFAVMGKL